VTEIQMRFTELAERSRTKPYQPRTSGMNASYDRRAFHNPRTSLGAAGHLLHMGMVAAPLVIGEVFHDADQRWRAMRMIPVLGAMASEILWTIKIANDRKKEEEAHAALEACREHCR
jgi:hypothetical protein